MSFHQVSENSFNPTISDQNAITIKPYDPLHPNQTAINVKDNNAAVIIPAGYDPNGITIIRHEDPTLPLPPRQEPQTVVDLLDDDSLEASAKLQFIRKVYVIVTILLAVTLGFCCLSYFVKEFFIFQLENQWVLYLFLGIGIVLSAAVIICGNDSISGMSNLIKCVFLGIINICFSYVVSYCTSYYASMYGAPLVVQCMVLTSALVSALTLYAFIVRVDFSTMIAILIVVFFCFIMFGVSFAFTLSATTHTLYGTFGVIIGGIILVIDTQWIAGGNRDCSLDDPIMGALIIYIDIIRIFLYMLMAMGRRGN